MLEFESTTNADWITKMLDRCTSHGYIFLKYLFSSHSPCDAVSDGDGPAWGSYAGLTSSLKVRILPSEGQIHSYREVTITTLHVKSSFVHKQVKVTIWRFCWLLSIRAKYFGYRRECQNIVQLTTRRGARTHCKTKAWVSCLQKNSFIECWLPHKYRLTRGRSKRP